MSSLPEIRIGSFNILNPYHAVKWKTIGGLTKVAEKLDPKNLRASIETPDWVIHSNWSERKEPVSENLSLSDIICLQEVATSTLADIQEQNIHLANAIICFHEATSEEGKHGTAILYNPSKAILLESHEITYEDEWYRKAACATFEIQGRIVRVVSVHLKGYNPLENDVEKKQKSKIPGFEELKVYLADAESNTEGVDDIIIAGDFNEDRSEENLPNYRPGYLEDNGYANDGNYSISEPLKERKIDWIYHKNLSKQHLVELTSLNLEDKQVPASDHLMIGTNIRWA